MDMLSVLFKTSRPNFLILTPICILLGLVIAINHGGSIVWNDFLLALAGGLAAHISVNMINEYEDFSSGLDLQAERTAFTGGSGTLPDAPQHSQAVLWGGVVSLLITMGIGVKFIYQFGGQIFPLGMAGVVLVVTYTRWLNKNPWLCLVAPGLGFGLLMVVGTQFILTGEYWLQTVWLGLIPFLLLNNLLLLNQYPDARVDKDHGRNHFPIAYGVKASDLVDLIQWSLSGALLLMLVWFSLLPVAALIALLPLALGFAVCKAMKQYGFDIAQQPKYLAFNVIMALSVPLIMFLALWLFD